MKYSNFLVLSLLILTQTACSNRSKTVIGGPDAGEAAIRMEESRQEYNDCVSQQHAGAATCNALEKLYDKDKAEYEAQVQ